MTIQCRLKLTLLHSLIVSMIDAGANSSDSVVTAIAPHKL